MAVEKFSEISLFPIQDLVEDTQYKVNVYAIVTTDVNIESKELHEKVMLKDGKLSLYTEEGEENT